MKIEAGILTLTEDIFPDGTICDSKWDENILIVFKSDTGRPVVKRQVWIGKGRNGEYEYKIVKNKLILRYSEAKTVIIPDVVPPEERARKIMGLDKPLEEVTRDDILQKIFDLAHECQQSDPKEAVSFRVAIDAFQWLYDEIKKQPKRISNEADSSAAFLEEWGITKE